MKTLICSILLLLASSCWAANVTLAWDASPDQVAGYKIYYGTQPGVYDYSIDAGPGLKARLINLPAGTYYFTVVSYDKDRVESNASNEVKAILKEVTGVTPSPRRPQVK